MCSDSARRVNQEAEITAKGLAIKLVEFLVVDASRENRRYCNVGNKKTLHTLQW